MCEPAIRGLRRLFPSASIAVLARPAVAELLLGHPDIRDVLVYDAQRLHAGLAGKWRLIQGLREGRFEMAVLFQNAFEAALLALAAGIPRRIGYATDGRRWLLTRAIEKPTVPAQQVHYYLDMLRPIGYEGAAEAPRLYLRPSDDQAMSARLQQEGVGSGEVLIGLNPGSTYGGAKRWLPERFAETAVRLLRVLRDAGQQAARVVILGAAGEEALGRQIASQISASGGAETLVWSGRTSIRELMAITKRCRLYVTNDTGPMHVAAAFGVPVVGVFGPTDWRTTAPYGSGHALVRQPVDCAPCLLRECPIDHRCMTGVTVDQVADAAERLLASGGMPRSTVATDRSPQHAALNTQHGPLSGVTVYLDRDGTLIEDVGYLSDPDKVVWCPGVMDGLRRLKAAGSRLVVVSNQSGVARGLITGAQLAAVQARLRTDLADQGLLLDGWFTCPHHPDDGCACRKPEPGMVEQAREALWQRSNLEYVIGDHERDVELATRIGGRSVLVTTGPASHDGLARLQQRRRPPDHVSSGFADAVSWVMADAASRATTRSSR